MCVSLSIPHTWAESHQLDHYPGSRHNIHTNTNTHTHTHTHTNIHTHTHAYLIDFMDLSSLPTGVLPGDSFLLLRKASRFFMSLALHKHAQKGKSWVLKVINKPTNQSKSWKTQCHKSKSDRQCSNPYKVPLPYMFPQSAVIKVERMFKVPGSVLRNSFCLSSVSLPSRQSYVWARGWVKGGLCHSPYPHSAVQVPPGVPEALT